MSQPQSTQLNPQPKARFLSRGAAAIKAHRNIMDNPDFQSAIDVALLQYQGQLSTQRTTEGIVAAANFYKVTGALEFVHVLKNLAEAAPEPPKRTNSDNLDQQ